MALQKVIMMLMTMMMMMIIIIIVIIIIIIIIIIDLLYSMPTQLNYRLSYYINQTNLLAVGRMLNAGFMSFLCTACSSPSLVTKPLRSTALSILTTHSAKAHTELSPHSPVLYR